MPCKLSIFYGPEYLALVLAIERTIKEAIFTRQSGEPRLSDYQNHYKMNPEYQ